MKTHLTNKVEICPRCHVAIVEELGDICQCVVEEPVVEEWEDKHAETKPELQSE